MKDKKYYEKAEKQMLLAAATAQPQNVKHFLRAAAFARRRKEEVK